jgi:tetratricopeptide (TPR) repeat protein
LLDEPLGFSWHPGCQQWPVLSRHVLRIVVVLSVVLASFLVLREVSGMDPIFFQPSWPGIKGLALYMAGSYDGAAKAYRAHWRTAIHNGVSTRDLGTNLLLSGDVDAAERLAGGELSRVPNAVTDLLLQAELALERDTPAEAIRLATRVLAVEPDSAEARVMLSLAYARAGAFDKAIDLINLALRSGGVGERLATFYQLLETTGTLGTRPPADRPLALLAHYHRYFRVFDQSQARPAARYARQAIVAGDRAADAYVTLGVLSEKAGRLDEALAAFHAAIEIDPRHAPAHRWAASIYGRRVDLVSEYRMVSTGLKESGDPFYSEYIFDVLINKIGDTTRAGEILEPLLARDPKNARLRERLGHIAALRGDGARALEHYRQAIALAPQDPFIRNGMGWALRRLGRVDEAIAAHRTAVALAPGMYQAHSHLMEIYQTTERYPEAIAEAQKALRLGEPNTYVHAVLCNLYHYEVDLHQAEACCQALLARDPGNAWALALLPKIRRDAVVH